MTNRVKRLAVAPALEATTRDTNVQSGQPALRVLLVEDNADDTELIIEELRAGGFNPEWTRVQSQVQLLEALNDRYDIILTDYRIPGWDVVKALRALRERHFDVPVIVVSGSIGEEQAVETLQEGAYDYVWKDRLRRLSDAVTRALDRRDADRAIKDSEQRYRSMFEANPIPMWVFDSNTLEFLAVNDAAIHHYGYARDEFLHMTLRDIRGPEDQKVLSGALEQNLIAGAAVAVGEYRHRKKDGTVIDVCVNSHAMLFMQRPARVVLATDITEQNAAKLALKQSEERFRRIAETVTEVFWVSYPARHAVVYVSPAYETVWGRSAQSLYQNPSSLMESVHPEDRARVTATLQTQADGVPFDHEYRIVRPDGEVRWIWDRGYPIRGDAGQDIQYLGAAQDITPRRRAEEALREGEERMRLALAASRVGVWETNLLTGHTYWSEVCEVVHGLEPGTFEKTFEAFVELVHPEDRAGLLKAIECATREHSQADLEYRTRRPDGTERLISCTAHFFYNEEGKAVRGTGIATDVTDRRSLESQLRQAQKMEAVGQLAGGVAHDFNNLLTAILGYTELLTPHFRKDDKRLKDLEQIRKSATRATHLTRQLLAFSRRQILLPVVLDLNNVVTDLTNMLRRVISEDIEIDLHLDPAIGRVKVDQGQVEQVIMNLAVNARDAMPEGGSISIATANVEVDEEFLKAKGVTLQPDTRQFVMLSVSDSGMGMDEATRCRIFEPFFTTKPKGKGTGLGLATVYGIVKQSGGFIWVYSEPGAGATFKVYLPRTDEDLVQDAVPAQAPAVRGSEVVLLVEDEEAVRMLARALLERYGYSVIEAADAEHAMQLVHERDGGIDLLLSDVVMPGKSGPELYAALTPSLPELKVLYMSGYTDEAIVRRGILEAGTHFVQKPFTAAGLMQKVREALDEEPAS